MRCLDALKKHERRACSHCNWIPPYAFPESRTLPHFEGRKISKDWHKLSGSRACRNDRFWQILLQKSFRGGARKFLEPLMRLARSDVRDHIASSKIDHG